jgi:hypothetical protein
LADKYFNQTGGIELLIGADLFYKLLQPPDKHALETIQYFREQFLAGQLLVKPQQTQILKDVKRSFLLGTSKMDEFIKHF